MLKSSHFADNYAHLATVPYWFSTWLASHHDWSNFEFFIFIVLCKTMWSFEGEVLRVEARSYWDKFAFPLYPILECSFTKCLLKRISLCCKPWYVDSPGSYNSSKDMTCKHSPTGNYITDFVKSVTLTLQLILFHIVSVNFPFINEAFPFRSVCYQFFFKIFFKCVLFWLKWCKKSFIRWLRFYQGVSGAAWSCCLHQC